MYSPATAKWVRLNMRSTITIIIHWRLCGNCLIGVAMMSHIVFNAWLGIGSEKVRAGVPRVGEWSGPIRGRPDAS